MSIAADPPDGTEVVQRDIITYDVAVDPVPADVDRLTLIPVYLLILTVQVAVDGTPVAPGDAGYPVDTGPDIEIDLTDLARSTVTATVTADVDTVPASGVASMRARVSGDRIVYDARTSHLYTVYDEATGLARPGADLAADPDDGETVRPRDTIAHEMIVVPGPSDGRPDTHPITVTGATIDEDGVTATYGGEPQEGGMLDVDSGAGTIDWQTGATWPTSPTMSTGSHSRSWSTTTRTRWSSAWPTALTWRGPTPSTTSSTP